MGAFPVEERLSDIAAALARNRSVVLTAPPGSGKTTCVPPALLDAPWLQGKKIVMLEPRRLAARACAEFIAAKLGETVGGTVGYQVRLERKVSARTRLEVVTEGLLANRLVADPLLEDVGLIIFDEFHERSLACDTAFAFALDVRRALRDDLRLLVMSATLDAGEVAARMGDAVTVAAEGRMFPVDTVYLGAMPMAGAIAKALNETEGDILCFLPGEGEIRRLAETLAGERRERVLPLYGALPKAEQDRVFAPAPERKVILATSIAETSLTLPGITCVIDSGLMRVPRFSPASGMSRLVTLPLSRDRAEQRRGRAGRVRSGVCYRLWTAAEEPSRPPRALPEILDADLAPLVLECAAFGAVDPATLPWMTPPPQSAWAQATALLRQLGALDERSCLTEDGKRLSRLPLHPRLANMLHRSRGDERAALLAAVLEEGGKSRETDLRRLADEVRETSSRPGSRRILELARRFARAVSGPGRPELSEGALLALAYPDRVAAGRGNGTFRMVSGRGAALEADDPLRRAPYLVLCELDDRELNARVFRACPIALAEIERLFGAAITEVPVCEWNARSERVESVVRRQLGAMKLGERPLRSEDASGVAEQCVAALLAGIRMKGVENLPGWTKETRQLQSRLNFLARHCGWPTVDDTAILAELPGFLGGMTKWRDLERLDLRPVLEAVYAAAGHTRRELEALAPERMEVPSGSHLVIHYEGEEPTVAARLQECFGLMATPCLAGGKVPVVMTLLSPAQRPIQVTKDLAGFWRSGYQLVRKDLRGRYPRHYWPEDPLTAVATRRVRPRPGDGQTVK